MAGNPRASLRRRALPRKLSLCPAGLLPLVKTRPLAPPRNDCRRRLTYPRSHLATGGEAALSPGWQVRDRVHSPPRLLRKMALTTLGVVWPLSLVRYMAFGENVISYQPARTHPLGTAFDLPATPNNTDRLLYLCSISEREDKVDAGGRQG